MPLCRIWIYFSEFQYYTEHEAEMRQGIRGLAGGR